MCLLQAATSNSAIHQDVGHFPPCQREVHRFTGLSSLGRHITMIGGMAGAVINAAFCWRTGRWWRWTPAGPETVRGVDEAPFLYCKPIAFPLLGHKHNTVLPYVQDKPRHRVMRYGNPQCGQASLATGG